MKRRLLLALGVVASALAQDLPVIPNNSPRGASNLTTVNAIPYVSASGVLNQDATNFCWDGTNHYLGIGTCSPSQAFQIGGAARNLQMWQDGGGVNVVSTAAVATTFGGQSSGMVSLMQGGNATANKMLNLVSGTSVGVGPGNTSPTGTFHIYDPTASTGVTTVSVRAGAGQSTSRLLTYLDNSGGVVSGISSGGLDIVKVASVASSATIAPTAPLNHITGTTTISTITAPSGFATSGLGGCLSLIPDGLWATNTAGNIAIATTAVVSKLLVMCYDNATSKWYPSY